MKIIHCADVHLGSKMESNLSTIKAKERKNEIYNNFVKLIEYAKSSDIKHIIIAGDLFDTVKGSTKLVKDTIQLFLVNDDISFYYLQGNHDEEIIKGIELPDNVYNFGKEFTYYDVDGVRIGGMEVINSKDVYFKKDKFNILILHGEVGKDINLSEFKNKNINYIALGHIHKRESFEVQKDVIASYPGCLEGRGFDETGKKGFYLLEIENNTMKQEFIPFSKRELHTINVDITGTTLYMDIYNRIKEATKEFKPKDLIKVVLKGEYNIDLNKNIDAIYEKIESDFYFIKIVDESKLKIDYNDYARDLSLLGEFVRTVLNDETIINKDEVLTYGIKALRNEEF